MAVPSADTLASSSVMRLAASSSATPWSATRDVNKLSTCLCSIHCTRRSITISTGTASANATVGNCSAFKGAALVEWCMLA